MTDYNSILLDQKRTSSLINEVANIVKTANETHYNAEDLEVRIELLDGYWTEFSQRDLILQREAETLKGRSYFKEQLFSTTGGKYLQTKAWLKGRWKKLAVPTVTTPAGNGDNVVVANSGTSEATTTNRSSVHASLEKLRLPRFDGKQRDWEAFKEKFSSLIISDAAMPSVIKFQHLCNCLDGEAAEKLKGIQGTGDNFQTAWDTLCRRYDNKNLRFSLQMQMLVNMPSATKECAHHLNQLLNTVNESINTFTTLERPVKTWDDILIYFIESKLAANTRMDWAKEVESKSSSNFPTFALIKTFLEDRIRTLDLVNSETNFSLITEDSHGSSQRSSVAPTSKDQRRKPFFKRTKSTSANVATHMPSRPAAKSTCSFCGGEHFVGYCSKFSACSQDQRRSHAATAKLCFNCLNSSHSVDVCNSKGRCIVCGEKHHTKLHREGTSAINKDRSSHQPVVAHAVPEEASCMSIFANHGILLSTARVVLQSSAGQRITVRALLDSGAEESFLTEHVAQALSLRRKPINTVVSGVGGEPTVVAKSSVNVCLMSANDSNFSFEFSALILRKLTALLPRSEISRQSWPHLEGLQFADPQFGSPSRVDCILNSAAYAAAILPGVKRGVAGTPVALQSVFGWILMGAVNQRSEGAETPVSVHHISVSHDLTKLVERFWETEEVPMRKQLTPEEESCYTHFRQTHTRNADGRFVVRLPFIKEARLSDTRSTAESCLKRIERRFVKQPELQQAYASFMLEYARLNHMQVVPSDQVKSRASVYLPHHPVLKKDGTNKIRVVFNASQKSPEGISLNSFLHIGPKLQEDILVLMIRWSFLPVVFSCDIVKMFRQFLVHEEDVDWQRILWRNSAEEPIQDFRLTTVTYGTACAPFLANACMIQLAEDEQQKYPQAAEVLRKNRYADDFFAGGDTLSEAMSVRDQLLKTLASAGMSVGKWATNYPDLLKGLGSQVNKGHEAEFQEQETVSTLGLRWISSEDAFCFKILGVNNSEQITKRSMLSEIARLFDPIGWLSPVVIHAKIMLQNLWMQAIGWDDPIPEKLKHAWIDFRAQLTQLATIRIPRWTGAYKTSEWVMHGFSDASERAYAAAVYVVLRTPNGISSRLMTAKAKVAPIKVLSLPKLELCGAHLLVRLVTYLLETLDRPPVAIQCWTDSQIVLAWLRAHPSRWKPFVANRVSEMVSTLPSAIWRHVRSADNPADLGSRGVSSAQLATSKIWWEGPEWLKQPQEEWPCSEACDYSTETEARKSALQGVYSATVSEEVPSWLSKFSSFDKLLHVAAYIYRWRSRILAHSIPRSTWLSAYELSRGRTYIFRLVQNEAFSSEIKELEKKETVSSSSPLFRLSPFIDQDRLLRVGGRLQSSFLSEDEKHPIVLPSKHPVTELVIRKAHLITLHGGPTLVQSHISRQYWIVKGRNFIRGVLRRCVQCARHNATTLEQQMGPLPAIRTRPARPFTYTGVDFAGPFLFKTSPGRGLKAFKGYVAVFICMVIKAVHLEVVSDLTTAAFLAAFRRFVARRGLCQVVYSDNGTNFQGAEAELGRLFSKTSAMSQEIAEAIALDGVSWSFIPPRAPNFGGLWEANVKSFKTHLRKVVGETKLTFEEGCTIAATIESCLNSRPLSLLSSSEEDTVALTPGHFLIGAPLTAPAEPFIEVNESSSLVSRWHLLTLMRNHFWRRWQREFLSQLQQRSKWLHPNRDFKVGDIVLFKDQLTPPTKWPLARIVQLHHGSDGLCRVATIKTKESSYKRAINKLILLPVNQDATSHLQHDDAVKAGGD